MSSEFSGYKSELISLGKLDQKIRNEQTYWDDLLRIDKEKLSKKLMQLRKQIGLLPLDKFSKVVCSAQKEANKLLKRDN